MLTHCLTQPFCLLYGIPCCYFRTSKADGLPQVFWVPFFSGNSPFMHMWLCPTQESQTFKWILLPKCQMLFLFKENEKKTLEEETRNFETF